MAIVAVRIDGRLLHGQVANMWVNVINPTRIMVVDDEAAASDVAKTGLKLAKPAGLNLSILNVEKAARNITGHRYDSQRVFILVKRPQTLIDLLEAGVELPTVNVGNMSQTDHTKALTKSINVVSADIAAFKDLFKRGVQVTAQMVPSDPVQDFKALIANSKLEEKG
ncbi:mannose/fructose/sorbose-specific PTS system IIB component [Ligilactobacillus salitolerans]|uniref:Mannose/fructose/sorbose-specific PTS system IIB component n=1 Tax=Ligilactobacillus salitolerans TaxID=1808352 RepID=A0A401IUE3_9LACO|nr:PTS sugar transporter subunit IIB [Ligilactobacillus salitolerans]GBG95161.1 mannose/fructose/sorbose-specific PTS system IIB component [Ligilactobacillus salitolerans]